MAQISIACLIYRSTAYADSVYQSIHKHTPLIAGGDADFYFVANDATPEVLAHLKARGYPHHVHVNAKRGPKRLFEMGIGAPEYIHRVYRAWNRAIELAQGTVVVLVNSDMFFSPNWLENLVRRVTRRTVVCSQLVERKHPRFEVLSAAIHREFGSHPRDFNEGAFLQYAAEIQCNKTGAGGAYMPCAIYKEVALLAGLFPEGNIAGDSFEDVVAYGDKVFFARLTAMGVHHITAYDSIVYHTKEGEMDD